MYVEGAMGRLECDRAGCRFGPPNSVILLMAEFALEPILIDLDLVGPPRGGNLVDPYIHSVDPSAFQPRRRLHLASEKA